MEQGMQSNGQTKRCPKCGEEIQAVAKKCKHCQADLRNWFARHKILTGILILIVIGILASAGGNNDKKQASTSPSEPKANVSETVSDTQEKARPEEAKAKEWVSIIKQQSSAEKQSDTFALQGGKQKIVYSLKGSSMTLCSVYIVKEGESLDKEGGIPEVMIDSAKEGETMARKDAGQYYLDVNPANGTCTVEVFEER